jgi:two-component system, sensor histidine kinase FlrB
MLCAMTAIAIPFDELQSADGSAGGGEEVLGRAFAAFAGAAASLERSYVRLQGEVLRLRQELEHTNRELASSLEENRRMRQHLQAILHSLPCGVLVVNHAGDVSLANPESQRLLNLPRENTLEAFEKAVQQMAADGSEIERKIGESTWVSIRRAEFHEAEGESSILILQDITGLKRLQEEHEAFQRQNALAEMSALLAHEIRNPLGSLELFAGLLAESELAEEQTRWVEHLQSGVRMLAATVNNVLHFHSRPQPMCAPTELGELVRSLGEFVRPLAQRAQVKLVLQPCQGGILVAADRDRLRQVILNLALNSLHFMPTGGRLEISHGAHGGQAWIVVSDSGSGIAQENLARIFEPGFTTRRGSPGLGLAVSKTILEQHRGTIAVSSQPGHGTTFTLQLPLWREPS